MANAIKLYKQFKILSGEIFNFINFLGTKSVLVLMCKKRVVHLAVLNEKKVGHNMGSEGFNALTIKTIFGVSLSICNKKIVKWLKKTVFPTKWL